MAKFLKTSELSHWIEKLIDETERELVIIVPYIKISKIILDKLILANKRGVETVLVYRENHMSEFEKEKFRQLDNLNLLHHPTLHAKCYYNEKYLIIGSMNLYEYSEKNNREMGILLHRNELDGDDFSNTWNSKDSDKIFNDAIEEIRDIIKSSELEKESRETIEEGFELDIIKTEYERAQEHCKILNKCFHNKIFEPKKENQSYFSHCSNYFDKIDVTIENRIIININVDEYTLNRIFNEFKATEYMYEGYKLYWKNYNKSKVYIYADNKHRIWKTVDSQNDEFLLFKNALSSFINDIKPLMRIK